EAAGRRLRLRRGAGPPLPPRLRQEPVLQLPAPVAHRRPAHPALVEARGPPRAHEADRGPPQAGRQDGTMTAAPSDAAAAPVRPAASVTRHGTRQALTAPRDE